MKPPQNSDLLKRLLEESVKRLADEQRQRKDTQDGKAQSLKRRASEVGETASATFDALFGAENSKVTQQLTDLQAKEDKTEIHDLFA